MKKVIHKLLVLEMTIYCFAGIAFFVFWLWGNVTQTIAELIYCAFMVASFGYLIVLSWVFPKFDSATHHKMLKKNYAPAVQTVQGKIKRKGIGRVVLFWLTFLAFMATVKSLGLLDWQLFLAGACIVFATNSYFSRKTCLLNKWIMRNKNYCCQYCGINGWDMAIFASALFFAPKMSLLPTLLNVFIIIYSFGFLVIWELTYHKHPERFYPQYNAAIGCAVCTKKCPMNRK